MPVTLAGCSLWVGLQTSVMICCTGAFWLMDQNLNVGPDVSSLYCLLWAMKTARAQLMDGFRVKLWE